MKRSGLALRAATVLLVGGLLSCDSAPTQPSGGTEVARVQISPEAPSLEAGATRQLQATVFDAAGNPINGHSVVWDTQNGAVAQVSQSGVVTGVAPGEAQVSASSGGRDGLVTVRVTAPAPTVATVSVTPSNPSVGVGGTVQLQATPRTAGGEVLGGKTASWASRNASVARVEQNGVVTGLLPGTAEIVATVDGRSGSTTVTVTPAPAGVLTVASLVRVSGDGQRNRRVGDRITLVVRALDGLGMPVSGATVTWATQNGSFRPTTSTTNNAGEASAEWTIGRVGDNIATAATSNGRTATFTAHANRS
jgi:hypothetical protein